MAIRLRLANEAWETLLVAQTSLMRGFANEPIWREQGVSMREYDVLYTLAKCDAAARIGELQQNVLLSQPALSRLVDRLAARGLVERTPDETDGRGVRVGLTPEGRRLQRAVGLSHARSVERELRDALTDDELEQLRRLCAKLGPARAAVGSAADADPRESSTDPSGVVTSPATDTATNAPTIAPTQEAE